MPQSSRGAPTVAEVAAVSAPGDEARRETDRRADGGAGSPLDTLYDRLADARDASEARRVEAAIVRSWLRSGSDTADLLLTRAHTALGIDDPALAIELIDRALVLAPDWAEAYAVRAQVFAALGDDERAVADLNQVLLRDARHFVALRTLADIFGRTGVRAGALALYERTLSIHPYLEGVRAALEKLRAAVEGQPL
ncbi:tetratricopeptide repeat protein [Pseudochelatococcus sp.]|uniref:tetratricopeptide repeat protein n=1 Tax=Pseudochelatococcus sp. TaxID=2020869 RepID=UPI003D906824